MIGRRLLIGRRVVALALLVGAATGMNAGDAAGPSVDLLGAEMPVSWLGAAGECFAAALLAWRRAPAAAGVALLLWCTATALVQSMYEGSCGCLGSLGAAWPVLTVGVWWAILAAGLIFVVRGDRRFGAGEAVITFVGAAGVLCALILVEQEFGGSSGLRVYGEIRQTTTGVEKGQLVVRNDYREVLEGLEVSASCGCVLIPTMPRRLESGATVRLPLDIVGRKPGVRPRVSVRARTSSGPVRRSFVLKIVGSSGENQ